jgi:hypothetical protein
MKHIIINFTIFFMLFGLSKADEITLIDFGAQESANIMDHNGWQDVFMDIYTDYRDIGPGGVITAAGSNGSYNYQGIQGDSFPFAIDNSIAVNWYNNSDSPITFTPNISFTDPDRPISGVEGDWYNMSRITISANSSYESIYNIDATSQGNYSLVNVNVNSDQANALLCDKIILAGVQADDQDPTMPTNLQAAAVSAYQIDLSWDESMDNIGVVGYKIYRNNVQIGISENNNYSDINLSPSSYYLYFVSAYDLMGNESVFSDSIIEQTHEGQVIKNKFITFDSKTGNHTDGFDNWHYSNELGYLQNAGGFYSDTDSMGHIRNFIPYYNGYNSDHMGWMRWGYADVETSFFVAGGGCMEFVMTGGAYDSSGTVAYSGLEVRNKEQFDAYIANDQNPYADIELPGGMSFYAISSESSSRNTFDEAQGTDRLSVWVYLPKDATQTGMRRPEINFSFYPFIDDGGGRHYYNYVTNTGMGSWTHVLFDAHPLHCNSGDNNSYSHYRVGGYDCPGDAVQFFNRIARFSLVVGTPIALSPTNIYLDEIEFYKVSQPENDETVANIGIGFNPDSNYFDIGFCDKYRGSVCSALYEVRYSFERITNHNYDQAKPVNIIDDESVNFNYSNDIKGQVVKPSNGYSQIWAKFALDAEDEALLDTGVTVFFAVKDISNRTFPDRDPYDEEIIFIPGIGDTRRIDLIKTIDYTIFAAPNNIERDKPDNTVKNFRLFQNYPNPFNPSTTICYSVPNPCRVRIKIYNQLGQLVRTLLNEDKLIGKEYKVTWDGVGEHGNKLASGIYYYRITAGKHVETKKMLYLR